MNQKFCITTTHGRKIGRGKENKYQDKIIKISTDAGKSWIPITFKELYAIAIEIGVNEEGLHPQKEGYRGYTMMLDEFNFQVTHGIEERLTMENIN